LLRVLFCGIVDDDIEFAELLQDRLHQFAAKRGFAHVSAKEMAPASEGFHSSLRLDCIFIFRQVRNADIGTLCSERHRNSTANATVSASDNGHFADEFSARAEVGSNRHRARVHRGFDTWLCCLMLGRKGAGKNEIGRHLRHLHWLEFSNSVSS